jgi:hypothetical protein
MYLVSSATSGGLRPYMTVDPEEGHVSHVMHGRRANRSPAGREEAEAAIAAPRRAAPRPPRPPLDQYIGIDYSGAATSEDGLPGLQVYVASDAMLEPRPSPEGGHWTRKCLAEWLVLMLKSEERILVGIDHAFGFPQAYLRRYGLQSYDHFLDDFQEHWATDTPGKRVEDFRGRDQERTGADSEFRLTERWTASAKSVFQFDVAGQVAKSTHAGLPWLRHVRRECRGHAHFWPFDGWDVPAGSSLVAEVYPSLFRRRYELECGKAHEHDAYAVTRWLKETCERGILGRYLAPPLTEEERKVVELEGWILGVA